MIEFLTNKGHNNLILFVHGFTGGPDTWVHSPDNNFPKLLLQKNEISENYDIAHFSYFTKLTTLFAKKSNARNLLNKWFKKSHQISRKNTSIEEISNLLRTEIRFKLQKYDNIIVIAHSMGGLVTKSCIIKDLEQNYPTKIKLFISLAVPHMGSNLATFGELISNNLQIKDLGPLNVFIHEMNDAWLKTSIRPTTKYFYGVHDNIVPKTSAVPIDKEIMDIISVDENHISISKPDGENDTTLVAVSELISEYQSGDPAISSFEIQTLDNENEYEDELFVLKLIVADIHNSSVQEAKEVFLNAEYARKIFSSASEQKRLSDLYAKIKKIYKGSYSKYLHGGITNSGLLLTEVNEQIMKEDKEFLSTLIPFINAIHKQGMLHQLANLEDDDIWWTEDSDLLSFKKKLKELTDE